MTNQTTNQSDIERVVMRRVRTIRVWRPIVSMGSLSALIFILALWGIGREVWVARVLENMPHSSDLASVARFYLAAFGHTRVLVQALSLLTLASVIYLAQAASRALTSAFLTPSRA